MFQKQAGSNYYIIGDNKTDADGNVKFSGKGVVVNLDTKDVQVFNGAKTWKSTTKQLNIELSQAVTGKELWSWTDVSSSNSTGYFSRIVGTTLSVIADASGLILIVTPNDTLAITFTFDRTTLDYGTKVPKGYLNVWLNGTSYTAGTDLFNVYFNLVSGKKNDTITLKDGVPQTDFFYIEYNGSITDFTLTSIAPGVTNYVDTQPTPQEVFQYYRCSIQGISGNTASLVTPSGVQQVPLQYVQVNQTVMDATQIIIPKYHSSQIVTLDYSKWSNVVSLSDEQGQPIPLKQVIDKQRSFTVTFSVNGSNTSFTSVVIPVNVPYVEKNMKNPIYYDENLKSYSFSTGECYMVNGVVYLFGEAPSNVTEDLTASTVTIQMSPTLKSFAGYKNGVWTSTDVRMKPQFNDKYTYLIFGKSKVIDLVSELGLKSQFSAMKYSIVKDGSDPKLIKDSKLTINVPEDTAPGTLLSNVKLFIVIDVFNFNISIDFVYETFSRVTYFVPGSDVFNSTVSASMRRRSMNNKYMFGNFVCATGTKCLAYNVSIDAESNVDSIFVTDATKLYPTVKFEADTLGTLNVGSSTCDIVAQVITADQTMPYTTLYNSLNNCNDLIVTDTSVTVPKQSGTCFFRLDDKVYLLRPETTKTVGFSLSRNSSAANTPRTDDLVPSAEAEASSVSPQTASPAPAASASPSPVTPNPASVTSNVPIVVAVSASPSPPKPTPVIPAKVVVLPRTVPVAPAVTATPVKIAVPAVQRPVASPAAPKPVPAVSKQTVAVGMTRPKINHFPSVTKHINENF